MATMVRARPQIDVIDLKAKTREILNRWPAVGLAVGVVGTAGLESFPAEGFADIASGARITEDTILRIASVTKIFYAIAALQLWEQGLVDLDAPANDYLRAFRLVPAKPTFRPATIRGGSPSVQASRSMFGADSSWSAPSARSPQ